MDKSLRQFHNINCCPAAFLGVYVAHRSKGSRLDFRRGIFLSWRIISLHVWTGCFCVSLSLAHVLFYVVFGEGPCILLTTEASTRVHVSHRIFSRVFTEDFLWGLDLENAAATVFKY